MKTPTQIIESLILQALDEGKFDLDIRTTSGLKPKEPIQVKEPEPEELNQEQATAVLSTLNRVKRKVTKSAIGNRQVKWGHEIMDGKGGSAHVRKFFGKVDEVLEPDFSDPVVYYGTQDRRINKSTGNPIDPPSKKERERALLSNPKNISWLRKKGAQITALDTLADIHDTD